MTSGHDERDATREPAPDLEYDLAHEGELAGRAAPPPGEPGDGSQVYVATQTSDSEGDYGYDLAHDVPGR